MVFAHFSHTRTKENVTIIPFILKAIRKESKKYKDNINYNNL